MVNSNRKKELRKFGQHLAGLRKQKNLSLRVLASNCDVDNSRISKIEKGRCNITLTTLLELSRGLEVHPKELLNYDFE